MDEVPRVDQDSPPESVPRRLSGVDAIKLHLTLLVGLALCTAAFWFELSRAEGGNSLSWAYVFEWPLFAVFAVYMWWNLLHGNRRGQRPSRPREVAPEHVEMLKAWNEHLRQMQADQEAGMADPGSETNAKR